MDFEGGKKDKRIYTIIAVLVLILILVTVILTSNRITEAYVSDKVLGNSWYEDYEERYSSSQLFGLEKQSSFTYRNSNSSYLSFVTVNTYKTLFMMNEKELYEKTVDAIKDFVLSRNVTLYYNSTIEGERTISNGHNTMYIRYDGALDNNSKFVKLVGETWNCEKSGTSIIVIGFSVVTNNSIKNLDFWNSIIKENGLISNVVCH